MITMKQKFESISFFCPAYNDEKNIEKVVSRADQMLKDSAKKYEIIVVEDGSLDKTLNVLYELKKNYPYLRIIHHEHNQGYGLTLRDGFVNAKYSLILYTDGDFQYDPLEFIDLLNKLGKYDAVIGYRINRKDSAYRYFQSKIFNFLINALFGLNYRDANCSMKVIKRDVMKKISIESTTAFIDVEIIIKLLRLKANILEVPVNHYPRLHGQAGGAKLSVILPAIKDIFRFFFIKLSNQALNHF
jgi:glycosyltransferase involved in cell wall biosynthesis